VNKLRFKVGTTPDPFSQSEMEKFRRMLRVDAPDFEFDDKYLDFIEPITAVSQLKVLSGQKR
jgi:hypothetical protein